MERLDRIIVRAQKRHARLMSRINSAITRGEDKKKIRHLFRCFFDNENLMETLSNGR